MSFFQKSVLSKFLKELKKAKVKLGLSDEAEWIKYFNEQKQKMEELQSEIAGIDGEIDCMIYELYVLMADVVKVVEGD